VVGQSLQHICKKKKTNIQISTQLFVLQNFINILPNFIESYRNCTNLYTQIHKLYTTIDNYTQLHHNYSKPRKYTQIQQIYTKKQLHKTIQNYTKLYTTIHNSIKYFFETKNCTQLHKATQVLELIQKLKSTQVYTNPQNFGQLL
jgi:hypothetical protein